MRFYTRSGNVPRKAVSVRVTEHAVETEEPREAAKEESVTVRKHETVRLDASRTDEAAAVMARAFEDDAAHRYVLRDAARRDRQSRWTFGALLRYCLPYGEVHTTPDLDGVACWMPPGSGMTDVRGMIRSGMVLAPLRIGPAAFVRFARTSGYMAAEHKRILPGPHWYLAAIGVEPSRRGEGVGAALLDIGLARADADGLPCYLETQNERNLGFYKRHGFEVVGEGEPDGLRVWMMLRPPRTPASNGEREKHAPFREENNNPTKEEK